jgi:hypothetical protein
VSHRPGSWPRAKCFAAARGSWLPGAGCGWRPRSASAALATAQPVGRDRTSPENPDVAVSPQPGPGPGSKRPHRWASPLPRRLCPGSTQLTRARPRSPRAFVCSPSSAVWPRRVSRRLPLRLGPTGRHDARLTGKASAASLLHCTQCQWQSGHHLRQLFFCRDSAATPKHGPGSASRSP